MIRRGDDWWLPLEPFAVWVEREVERLGGKEPFAEAVGVNPRHIAKIVTRREGNRPKRYVTLSSTDKIMTAVGAHVWELGYITDDNGRPVPGSEVYRILFGEAAA